jgi:16S rRNA (guanine966-N2)-methyltransferase
LTGGQFRGRFIQADVGKATHPMGERIRLSLFNMIDVEGKTVLDAFAGTGALGFEALSRGAKSVTFIERDKTAQQLIDVNITTLDVGQKTKLIKTSVNNWLTTVKNAKFDVILIDPPYDNPQFSTALKLKECLNLNGLMILSYSGRLRVPTVNGVVVVDNRSYGEAALAVFRLGILDSARTS